MHRSKKELVELLRIEKSNHDKTKRQNVHMSNVLNKLTVGIKEKLQKSIDKDKLTFDERNAKIKMLEFIDNEFNDAVKYAQSLFSIPDLDYTEKKFSKKSPHDRLIEKGWEYDERDDVYSMEDIDMYLNYSSKEVNLETDISPWIDIDTIAIIYALLKSRGGVV